MSFDYGNNAVITEISSECTKQWVALDNKRAAIKLSSSYISHERPLIRNTYIALDINSLPTEYLPCTNIPGPISASLVLEQSYL